MTCVDGRWVAPPSARRLSTAASAQIAQFIAQDPAAVPARVAAEAGAGWHVLVARVSCKSLASGSGGGGGDSGVRDEETGNSDAWIDAAAQLGTAAALPGTLVVFIAQPPTETAADLSRQRRACSDPRSCAVWTEAREKSMCAAVRTANTGRVAFMVI